MGDEDQIRELISQHFEAMAWSVSREPDWERFGKDFHPGAVLCGAARPAMPRDLEGFIERMESVARQNLNSFEEHTRGMKILRFGNVAVVLAASELLENDNESSFDVSAYLLIKSDGRWSILGHAWDQASEENPVPGNLL